MRLPKVTLRNRLGKVLAQRPAHPVAYTGFEAFTFFAHTVPARVKCGRKRWAVTEASTGARIAGGDTQCEAIRAARTVLEAEGIDNLRAKIEEITSTFEMEQAVEEALPFTVVRS